ncbi:MAG: FtsX-like permease family protein [Planctomycetes bacterium]|nr:FtsX-like permease family protein [Planctomycetota bacterium]
MKHTDETSVPRKFDEEQMYKLFLCVRFLVRRPIAYLAMICVFLVVALMISAVSIMSGFLHKIEVAAKGLFGDIIVESDSQHGLACYDDLMREVKAKVPQVEAASPFILSYGMLRIPGQDHYRQAVQIAGIRLPERVDVTDFGKGLFFQAGQGKPTFDPPRKILEERIVDDRKAIEGVRAVMQAELKEKTDKLAGASGAKAEELKNQIASLENYIGRINTALYLHEQGTWFLKSTGGIDAEIARVEQKLERLNAMQSAARTLYGMGWAYRALAEWDEQRDGNAIKMMESQLSSLYDKRFEPPSNRVILGLGVSGLSFRTPQGQTVRYMVPGMKVVLYVYPLGRNVSLTNMSANTARLTVVDDCRTDVYSIDSEFVWMPFETLQKLNNMDAFGDMPARCSQVHIKVRGQPDEAALREICRKIDGVWSRYRQVNPQAANTLIEVRTWRQRQERVIAPLESQRTLAIIICGMGWVVTFILIVVVFYIIVVHKTPDIGVLKAIGASGTGVASIFLIYGALVGLIGSALGSVAGCYIVKYINPIHDLAGKYLGYQIWRKENYMFAEIPNEVDMTTVAVIIASAIIAGLLGALIPSIRAARMQPVESLRYE